MSAEELMVIAKRRGFFIRSFDAYGGEKGFYDYGPLGTLMKNSVISLWRRHMVVSQGFSEIDCVNITPYRVLKASGHVDKFSDIVVSCEKCQSEFRADHIVPEEDSIGDGCQLEYFTKYFSEKEIRCPDCGGILRNPSESNLMFSLPLRGGSTGFLRPETAQGIFVNFPSLYRWSRQKLPMGIALVGKGYRNEISPRQGIIRMREFNMAEIEIFIDPAENLQITLDKDKKIQFLSGEGRELNTDISSLFSMGIINNLMLALQIYKIHEFLIDAGINADKLRFRQHRKDELAHYANDCWDAEALLESGWVEIVGIADRTCYDLTSHSRSTGEDFMARRMLETPVVSQIKRIIPDKKAIGKKFAKASSEVFSFLEKASINELPGKLMINNEEVIIDEQYYKIIDEEVTETVERFIPAVVEPSFGIDRIIYSILEHSMGRTSEDYNILHLKPEISPFKAGIFPLISRPELDGMAKKIFENLSLLGINAYYDDSGTIGRRYARMDEIGTPFSITVDFDSIKDGTVTVRHRDTREQSRISSDDVVSFISEMI